MNKYTITCSNGDEEDISADKFTWYDGFIPLVFKDNQDNTIAIFKKEWDSVVMKPHIVLKTGK